MSHPDPQITEIVPASGWRLPALRDLFRHADLVYFLAKRDVTVRYKQTAVGALWAVLQPLMLARRSSASSSGS